jgi:hypothetical protein
MGMATVVKTLLALLWLVNSARGFVPPTPLKLSSFDIKRTSGMAQRRQQTVSQQMTFISLADFDTMTLNWIGLAVGTLASLLVYQMDQNQETATSTSTVMASATLAPPPPVASAPPKKETATPVAVSKPAAPVKVPVVEAATPKPVVKVMKETQQEIKQNLQQVGEKLQTTAAAAAATDSPVFTEPYSDQVKLSVKRKSRFVGKLTKKVFMPWKAWSDL